MVRYIPWQEMKSSMEKNEPGQGDRTCWVANLEWGRGLLFFYKWVWDDLIDWVAFEERPLGREAKNLAHTQEKSFPGKTSHSVVLQMLQAGSPSEGGCWKRQSHWLQLVFPYPQMPHMLIQPTAAGYYLFGLQLVESVNSELKATLKDLSICGLWFLWRSYNQYPTDTKGWLCVHP